MAQPETDRIHAANARYHDLAAAHYDAKWGIDYGEAGRRQVTRKLAKTLGAGAGTRFESALEIGAGTGYFGINLALEGVIGSYTATDISPAMIEALRSSAATNGVEVDARAAAAESLPFEDDSFDLVFGHAVLHHLPDLGGAFAELRRVLRPGGAFAFAGEPSRYGDRLSALPKRLGHEVAPLWRRLVGAGPAQRNGYHQVPEEDELERLVDVHAFTPASLRQAAEDGGMSDVRVGGEELTASLFGWTNRALEATALPEEVPMLWRQYAFHGYLALQRLDRAVLEGRLPAAVFYNLLVSGRAP